MNNVSLTGRLTREPELRYGGQDNSTAITRFTLAVDDGKDTDFINIKCFGRTAEWAQKWLSKGSRAEVTGKIKITLNLSRRLRAAPLSHWKRHYSISPTILWTQQNLLSAWQRM